MEVLSGGYQWGHLGFGERALISLLQTGFFLRSCKGRWQWSLSRSKIGLEGREKVQWCSNKTDLVHGLWIVLST